MSMSTLNARIKKRGRPSVDSEEVRSRIQQPLLGELDEWAEKQGISRAEAVRRLIRCGLNSSKNYCEEGDVG